MVIEELVLALKINHKRSLCIIQLFDLRLKRKIKVYKKVEKNNQEDLAKNNNQIEYKKPLAK
jgi:hypothetical protein